MSDISPDLELNFTQNCDAITNANKKSEETHENENMEIRADSQEIEGSQADNEKNVNNAEVNKEQGNQEIVGEDNTDKPDAVTRTGESSIPSEEVRPSTEVVNDDPVAEESTPADLPPTEKPNSTEDKANENDQDELAEDFDESDHEGLVEDVEPPSDDCESNNEFIIADDKTLDAIESDSETRPKKQRRRILVDDSEDNDSENEREEILRSCTPDNSKNNSSDNESSEENERKNDSTEEIIDPEVSEMIARERPGPKSKKSSTYLMLEHKIEARNLLKTAVVIQAIEKKKRAKRVLESDDDSIDEKSQEPDVFDIGMQDDECTMDSLNGPSVLLSENISADPNFVPLEGVEIGKIDEIVPIENPVLPQEEEEEPPPPPLSIVEVTPPMTNDVQNGELLEINPIINQIDQKPTPEELSQINLTFPEKSPEYSSFITPITPVPASIANLEMTEQSTTPTLIADLTDNNSLQIIKKEPELDQKTSEQFLADALRSQFSNEAPPSMKKLENKGDPDNMNTTFWGIDSSSEEDDVDDWTNNYFSGSKSSRYGFFYHETIFAFFIFVNFFV